MEYQFDTFCEEFLQSIHAGSLSDYCVNYWDATLLLFDDSQLIMDKLQEKAIKAVEQSIADSLQGVAEYWKYVEELKEQFES